MNSWRRGAYPDLEGGRGLAPGDMLSEGKEEERQFGQGRGEAGEGKQTPARLGVERASGEIHSQQDELRGPTFPPLPPRSKPGTRTRGPWVSGKDPTARSSPCLWSKHATLPYTQSGLRSRLLWEPSWNGSHSCSVPLGKLKSCASSSRSRRGSRRSRRACCLATQREAPGSFTGQSCPRGCTRSNQRGGKETRANIY